MFQHSGQTHICTCLGKQNQKNIKVGKNREKNGAKHQVRRANVAKAAALSFNSPQEHVTPARVRIVYLLEIQISQLWSCSHGSSHVPTPWLSGHMGHWHIFYTEKEKLGKAKTHTHGQWWRVDTQTRDRHGRSLGPGRPRFRRTGGKRKHPSPVLTVQTKIWLQRFLTCVDTRRCTRPDAVLSIAWTRLCLVAACANAIVSYEKRYQPPADRVWTQRPSRHLHLSTPHYHGNYSRHLATLPD